MSSVNHESAEQANGKGHDEAAFGASKLGRKDHWNSVYDREINNFKETGDIGEVWFGEDTASKMVSWVCSNIDDPSARILDVGCGNGHLLLELSEEGYTNLVGTDYSAQAIELAQSIAQSRQAEITYVEQDFLDAQDVARVAGDDGFDVVLDKGTYDAICLKPKDTEAESVDQTAIEAYPVSVVGSLKDSGVFLITSCNWTEDELMERFEPYLQCVGRIKHRSFQFGGVVGQTVATVAFRKKLVSRQ
ncbi:Protein-lysine N-methyltransferase efm4 [Coemansia sp. IMI 203386]|nr:Protein-lysine N-methyltransferase efm4 [Coemansia sp. IMI 203386]